MLKIKQLAIFANKIVYFGVCNYDPFQKLPECKATNQQALPSSLPSNPRGIPPVT